MTNQNQKIAAGLIVIGTEILSGRTQDRNVHYLAQRLSDVDVPLKEVAIIPDCEAMIVHKVRDFIKRFTYVFTTGGIGPTHDDITSACVAKALGRPLEINKQAYGILRQRYYSDDPQDKSYFLSPARLKMAEMPKGAVHICNPISKAPGYKVENIFVLAGVPEIMQAMLDDIIPYLSCGAKLYTEELSAFVGEGFVADELSKVQQLFPDVEIGSYPFWDVKRHGLSVVLRGFDAQRVAEASAYVTDMLEKYV